MMDAKEAIDLLGGNMLGVDFVNIFIGDRIGIGTTRAVYEYALDKRYVVKIESSGINSGDNLIEWRIWQNVKCTIPEIKNWFAPCLHISPSGNILIQKRTTPLQNKESKIPDNIPSWFTDIKFNNFGWIGKNMACHDYAACIDRFAFFALNKRTRSVKGLLK